MIKVLTNSFGKPLMNQQGKVYGVPVEAPENDVNFYDFDGFRVASYSKSDFANLTALPANPTHTGLTAQGWNWALADAKTFVAQYGSLDIGQNYITSDGKTRIYIEIEKSFTNFAHNLSLKQSVTNGVTIDWGDGSATETFSGTTQTNVPHTYATGGSYVITFDVAEGCVLTIGVPAGNIGCFGNTNKNRLYPTLKNIELGTRLLNIGSYCCDISTQYFSNQLETITVPANMNLGVNSFYGCGRLKFLVIPSGETNLPNFCFTQCIYTKVSLPKSVDIIGTSAVAYNHEYLVIILPPSITTIGNTAFRDWWQLVKITVPNTISSIGNNCFQNCYGLKEFHIEATTPPSLGATAFSGYPSDFRIYVPRSENQTVLNEYKSATNWNAFASIIEEEPLT